LDDRSQGHLVPGKEDQLKLRIGIDGNMYEVEVEVTEEDETPHPSFPGPYPMVPATVHAAPAPAAPAAPAKSPAPGAATGDEDKLCRSPIAGIVIRANVAPGQKIAENDLIMVIEAMKMETNVTAQRAGTVKSVKVAPGEPVKAQQVLIEFE
jgi:methylmalonyl-CoA carboxyltransferase small subunit